MFANPLGLLALAAVPAVLALHLFRRRFRPRAISALFLWRMDERSPSAGRRRERLPRSPSLWLELGLALLLALTFAGPRGCGAGRAGHLVAVLDSSASMSARVGGSSAAERAADLVRERIRALPRGGRVTLVRTGPRPDLLVGPAALPGEALAALERWRPGARRHDPGPAIALAEELAGEGALLLLTDRFRPEDHPERIEVVAVGRPADNLALTRASRTRVRDPATGEALDRVFLTAASFAVGPARTELRLTAGGELLERRALELAAGERVHIQLDLPPDAPCVLAELPPDALELDGRAWLAPNPPRTLALWAELPLDLARFLGLAGQAEGAPAVGRWLDLVPESIAAGGVELAHLVISQGVVGSGTTWCLSLEGGRDQGRRELIGPFLVEKRHPLLEGVTLEGIVWSADAGLRLPDAPLVSAGSQPLLTERREGERVVLRMNVDPRRSSLQRSPDWPILLANLAELRRAELPGPARTNLAVGEAFTFRGAGEGPFVLEAGDGSQVEVRGRGTLVFDAPEDPGLYALSAAGRELCRLGVRFADAGESDLTGLRSGHRPAVGEPAEVRAALGWIEMVLLFLALVLLSADWLALARGRRPDPVAGASAGGGARA